MDMSEDKQSRRSMLKSIGAGLLTAAAGLVGISRAEARPGIVRVAEADAGTKPQLFSGAVVHNGLVYLSGMGYHEEGDISKATQEVLAQMKQKLEKAGSSMEHVLKVNVYLADLADYKAMNKVYYGGGRFGDQPPVRTTVATYGGVPGDSLVEIDCIAALK